MFSNASEKTLDKVYDWITYTYYSPYPDWAERDYGPERRRDRLYAIHALNDMRALYAGVGNNGWWDEERVLHLHELRDIIPYSMEQVLWQNAQIREYYVELENSSLDDADFFEEHAPDIMKMQGNKDGKLYEYTKELFWDSVEWFLNSYGWWQEKKVLREILEAGAAEDAAAAAESQKKRPKSARKVS